MARDNKGELKGTFNFEHEIARLRIKNGDFTGVVPVGDAVGDLYVRRAGEQSKPLTDEQLMRLNHEGYDPKEHRVIPAPKNPADQGRSTETAADTYAPLKSQKPKPGPKRS